MLSVAKSGKAQAIRLGSSNYFQGQQEPLRHQAGEHLGWILVIILATLQKVSVPVRESSTEAITNSNSLRPSSLGLGALGLIP